MAKQYNDPFFHVDYNALVSGCGGNGINSGLSVTERGAGQNMSVDVAAGTAIINKLLYTETGVTNINISAAHATLPRRDIIIYDVATTIPIVITGIPAIDPIPPDITNGDILLAVINVAALVTVITNSDIENGQININKHASTHYCNEFDPITYYDPTVDNTIDNNSSGQSLTTSNIKEKESKIDNCADTIFISFDLSSISSSTSDVVAIGRIYRNGVAVGTTRSKSNENNIGTFTSTYTETISGWSNGDLLQLYGYHNNAYGGNGRISNLKINGKNMTLQTWVENITHQDP